MPLTGLEFPILTRFLCAVETMTGLPPQPLDASTQQQQPQAQGQSKQEDGDKPKPLPKGIVLGPDGKPCRTCTSISSWKAMTKQFPSTKSGSRQNSTLTAPHEPRSDCPPDVDLLGRSTWTLLHSITANYPENPSPVQQSETKQFIGLFSKIYPCWVCADDFRAWMKDGNEPKVSNRDEFGRWMCEAHNAVNVKLGKESFNCDQWQERWRTGWKDGSCD